MACSVLSSEFTGGTFPFNRPDTYHFCLDYVSAPQRLRFHVVVYPTASRFVVLRAYVRDLLAGGVLGSIAASLAPRKPAAIDGSFNVPSDAFRTGPATSASVVKFPPVAGPQVRRSNHATTAAGWGLSRGTRPPRPCRFQAAADADGWRCQLILAQPLTGFGHPKSAIGHCISTICKVPTCPSVPAPTCPKQ